MKALLLMLICMAGCPGIAEAQERQEHVEIPLTVNGFQPAAQQRATFNLKDVTVTVEPSVPISLLIEGDGVRRGVVLPPEVVQVNSVARYGKDRLIVLGMVNGDVWMAVVVNPARRSVVDSFLCYSPAVSPDGRYIVFIKFFPSHGITSAEDHVMLYDVSRTPTENRPVEAVRDRAVVGKVLFPPGAGNRAGDNVELGTRPTHRVASDSFFWDEASTRVVFADDLGGVYSAVVARITDGKDLTESQVIPSNYICPVTTPPCYERLTSVDFSGGDGAMKMVFRGVNGTPARRSILAVSQLSTGLDVRRVTPPQ